MTQDEEMRDERLKKLRLESEIKRLEIRRRDPSNRLGWTQQELQTEQEGNAEFQRWARSQPVKKTRPWYIVCGIWIVGVYGSALLLVLILKGCSRLIGCE